jgi:hypothetical protein
MIRGMSRPKKNPAARRRGGTPAVEIIDIGRLRPDPANLNQHPEEQREQLQASFTRFGAARSITIDAKNIATAGSGALEAARAAGIKRVIVIDSDGTELVAVRRRNLGKSEGALYGVADNQLAKASSFDNAEVAKFMRGLAAEGYSFEGTGFDEAEVQKFLDGEDEDEDPAEAGRASGMRQLVLIFDARAHAKFLRKLDGVKVAAKAKNNTDAISWLVDRFARQRA